MARHPLFAYIVTHPEVLLNIDFAREIWMIPDRLIATSAVMTGPHPIYTLTCMGDIYLGKLFVHDQQFYAVTSFTRTDDRMAEEKTFSATAQPLNFKYDPKETKPLCTPQDQLLLQPGDIGNYLEGPALDTTIGLFFANYLFLVYPFGNTIPYLNEEITTEKLEEKIAIPLMNGTISPKDTKDKYINALTLFGQATEIFCPNISEKTIVIPPSIDALRKKLVAENKEALDAGDISVMTEIEDILIKAYREHLKGDSSLHFLLKKKYFNVTLKKLFLTQGMTEKFGQPGKFVFIDNPMGQGWKIKDLKYIFDEVRAGAYSRAVETADGGVIAKLILRVLQDTRIDTLDCGTTRGEHVVGTKTQLKDFMWNYIINPDNSTTVISPEILDSLVGKSLIIRTPGYCQAKKGYCAKCFGKTFEELGQQAFAPVANDFARNQTTASLKKMHGSSHSAVDVSDINRFLV